MSKTAIIPVAGLGTRLLPISAAVPKELLPLGRKPALQWIGEELGEAGADRFVLVNSPHKPELPRLFDWPQGLDEKYRTPDSGLWSTGPYRQMPIDVALQHQQLGLGHAVLCARELVGDQPFIVALGDCVYGPPGCVNVTQRLVELFDREQADGVIAFEPVPREKVSRYGIAAPNGAGDVFGLRDLVEKPSVESAPSNLAVAARYVFSPRLWPHLAAVTRGVGGELQLTDAIRALIRAGGRVFGWRVTAARRFDVGTYESYVEAQRVFVGEEEGRSRRHGGTGEEPTGKVDLPKEK
jgi:UTP--glucose-1-phosphate uridylyltransferase